MEIVTMAYFNAIMNDAVMKERQQAFQVEAARRQLVRIADEQKNMQKNNNLKTSILAALCRQAAKVVWLQPSGVEARCKA